jgi:hypothetical protein
MSISRPTGSTRSLRRGSAYEPTSWWLTRNRHGCVLCTDGARATVAIQMIDLIGRDGTAQRLAIVVMPPPAPLACSESFNGSGNSRAKGGCIC